LGIVKDRFIEGLSMGAILACDWGKGNNGFCEFKRGVYIDGLF
jgi:hypothetical protein